MRFISKRPGLLQSADQRLLDLFWPLRVTEAMVSAIPQATLTLHQAEGHVPCCLSNLTLSLQVSWPAAVSRSRRLWHLPILAAARERGCPQHLHASYSQLPGSRPAASSAARLRAS